jgi:hypothetical protein
MKNVEQLNFYVLFNNKLLIVVYIPQSNNIKGILYKYLISIVNAFCFATTGVSISTPSIYFPGTYGQSIKLAKKPRTLF